MNVTLILGNGFDLNMGLPTSYSDFYKYYLQVDSPKSTTLIKQEIGEKPRNWADLEKSLGEISKKYLQDSDAYIEAFENVRDELAKYLREVDKFVIPNLDNLAEHLLQDILDIDRYLDNKPKQEYRDFLKIINSPNDVELNVINFNYTSTVEKMMTLRNERVMPPKKVTFREVFHVHQDLNTGILMGVNDESQIANESYGNDFDIRAMMVKPFINEMYAAGNDKKAFRKLEHSDVIIIFGISFGETDEIWWNGLRNATFNKNTCILYSPYENASILPLHETNVIRKIHYFKDFLAKRLSGGNLAIAQNLYNRIYPIRNNHLFEFRFSQQQRNEVRKEIIERLVKRHSF